MKAVDIVNEQDLEAKIFDLTSGKFVPESVIWRSDYYGTGKIGSIHYLGKYLGEKAVLKVQGAKPAVSEAWMIERCQSQNNSRILRPPHVLETIPWNDTNGFEVLIMEYAQGPKIIESGRLVTQSEVDKFFDIYQEYRQKMRNTPWLSRPEMDVDRHFDKLFQLAKKIKPLSPFRQHEDAQLANQAREMLKGIWLSAELEFQHGHFSAEDLICQGDQIVLFSNLFWQWKFPFYDTVFAYHWVMYTLAQVPEISPDRIEEQRQIWLAAIAVLPQAQSAAQKKLLGAALLERAVAGLLVDGFSYIEEKNPIAEYLIDSTRTEVKRLIQALSGL